MTFGAEFKEGFKLSLAALMANKARAVLTMLGIIIGIISVTMMGAAIEGLTRAFNNSISAIGADVLYIQKWPWMSGDEWWKYRNRRNIKPEYADIVKKEARLAAAVAPTVARIGTVKYQNKVASSVFVEGTTADYAYVTNMSFDEGRFFTAVESRGDRPLVVLGGDVANQLFPNQNPDGKIIQINGLSFRVIGVRSKQGSFLGMFSLDNQVMIPLGQFERIYGTHFQATINVRVVNQKEMDNAKEELRGIMRKIRGLSPYQEDDFSINQQDMLTNAFNKIAGIIGAVGIFVTALSLFVGGIGIMNIMFVSVTERTKEIGIRKALGARRQTILVQFLIESTLICLAGGLVGLGISYPLSMLVDKFLPTSMPISLAILGIMISLAVGVISGIIPALRASKLDPVEALRYE
ncbi:MAG: ABC transporter permease [Bacteroidetes bacterium]|nr:ABC transporter permease [Bacteroidota bacterium]MCL5738744.1 ABC transporter permease [Bacteroidota bacterium]